MSGTFEDIDVPPTLVSFAVSVTKMQNVISPEFKKAASKVYYIAPKKNADGTFQKESLMHVYEKVAALIQEGKVLSCFTPTYGGLAEGIMKASFGNHIGFHLDESFDASKLYDYDYAAFALEMAEDLDDAEFTLLGETTCNFSLAIGIETIHLREILDIYEGKLEPVFPSNVDRKVEPVKEISFKVEASTRVAPKIGVAKPRVLIPVFPGTNCEYDTARALARAGADPHILVIKNLSSADIAESVAAFKKEVKASQIIMLPGGFSGGDEPDGSGKFITAFLRNPAVKEEVHALLKNRDGLMAGICNGFQALIKLGLVPFGEITEPDAQTPTLTFNTIGRHQSRLVRTRIASNKSPWLSGSAVGDMHTVAISHGEGRFICPPELLETLIANGQIATQYVDLEGKPTMEIAFNPNGSTLAVEGITSPDGRVFGKMGHSERISAGVYKNVDGEKDNGMFRNAVNYFKI